MKSPRSIFKMLWIIVALLGTYDPSAVAGTPKPDVGDGHVAWFDISTKNMTQAKEFYGKLFGWTFTSLGTEYAAEINQDGKGIGTLRAAEGKISQYNGVVYIQVTGMEAMCEKAKKLGATVVEGFPFDLSEGRGAVGLIVDPTGHP